MGKLVTLDEAMVLGEELRSKGRVIVATNGCFDILHTGHVRNLADAKALGDVLFVGVNADTSVQDNKGVLRPIIPEQERAEIIAALAAVDYAFIFTEKTPFSWIRRLRPNIHVKGGADDVRNHPDFPEMERAVNDAGAKFVLVPHHEGRSTSSIIKKIQGGA